ncbi:hypothetical protein GOP47_0009292 [Adiantum capillus-veneris]|uniref:Uncharacterized protein n=1 Tax=Adiantum capillus-veneris TaxID=13818 RepID=A0A9D4UWH0_ADICA|nr:hypothetical protein GOP47_0009292 [Adiantum capillus-veneris]
MSNVVIRIFDGTSADTCLLTQIVLGVQSNLAGNAGPLTQISVIEDAACGMHIHLSQSMQSEAWSVIQMGPFRSQVGFDVAA